MDAEIKLNKEQAAILFEALNEYKKKNKDSAKWLIVHELQNTIQKAYFTIKEP